MKFRFNCAAEDRENPRASAFSWRRKALAMGTAALLAFSLVAPAWASPVAPPALSAAGAAAKLAVVTPALSSSGGCQLNSPRGKVKHVVTIIFDNTHFMRDPHATARLWYLPISNRCRTCSTSSSRMACFSPIITLH